MLYMPSPKYAGMPFAQWLNTPEGRRQRAAREQMNFDPAAPGSRTGKARNRPSYNPDDVYEPAPQLPQGWSGTPEELAAAGFGTDATGGTVYRGARTPKPPKITNGRVTYPPSGQQPTSRPAPIVSPGVRMAQPMPSAPGIVAAGGPGASSQAGMGQQVPPPFIQGPFIPGIGYQPVPNPAYGEAMGLEWDGQQWVKKNPMADLEREAAELALQQKRLELEQAKNSPTGGPDLRELMAEARQAMKDQRQQRAYAEQLAREMSDEEIAASGRPWRWDGNQMQYTDTPEEERRLERNRAQASKQQGDANRRREQRMRQMLKNSREIAFVAQAEKEHGRQGRVLANHALQQGHGPLSMDRKRAAEEVRRFAPGRAQPIPPQDDGTPYGEWAGGAPSGTTLIPPDFTDRDGDGIDDRMQPGPGRPMFPEFRRRRQAKAGGKPWGAGYHGEPYKQRLLKELSARELDLFVKQPPLKRWIR